MWVACRSSFVLPVHCRPLPARTGPGAQLEALVTATVYVLVSVVSAESTVTVMTLSPAVRSTVFPLTSLSVSELIS